MSESCFDHNKVDNVKRKARGVLQFCNASKKPRESFMKGLPPGGGGPDGCLPEAKDPVLEFDRTNPRVQNIALNNKLISREEKRAMIRLPAHMHNVHNRLGCGNVLERSLRETKYQKANWFSPPSMAQGKKSFR